MDSSRDAATGLPVYSLYGDVQRPTAQMLEGIDALVFDIQDVGARFYTYITTLGYCLEAAGKKGIEFYVLDRPNPINGAEVDGPVLDPDLRSFIGYFPMPIRHGMTVGELAEMFNRENHLNAKLHVIKMQGWQRTDWFDETGQAWINPSPNLRNLTEETLYPGVCLLEGANVSVGRGTDTPFEMVGAPWIDGRELAAYLNGRKIQGVRFLPMDFTAALRHFRRRGLPWRADRFARPPSAGAHRNGSGTARGSLAAFSPELQIGWHAALGGKPQGSGIHPHRRKPLAHLVRLAGGCGEIQESARPVFAVSVRIWRSA